MAEDPWWGREDKYGIPKDCLKRQQPTQETDWPYRPSSPVLPGNPRRLALTALHSDRSVRVATRCRTEVVP